MITDMKAIFATPAQFANMQPVPFIIDEFDQVLGIDVPLGCGGVLNVNLGTFHLRETKTGNNAWQLQLIQ